MKRYPAYKDSGVEWIGEIPEHWKLSPLTYLSKMIVPMRDKPKDLNGDIPWLRIEDFNGKQVSESKTGQGVSRDTVDYMNLKVFPTGTVLCSCSCNMGITAIVKNPLVTNQTFIGIVPGTKLNSGFTYYLMQAASQFLNAISTGAIQTYLSRNEFERLRIPLPPTVEQITIDQYLDNKTTLIDTLIAKKQRQIELLQEQRAAIINQAVTKGLDPSVPMKESEIPWLGEVPEQWKPPIKFSLLADSSKHSFVNGPFGSDLLTSELQDKGVPVIYIRDIKHGMYFRESKSFVTRDKALSLDFCRVDPNDLLIAKVGDPPGTAALYPIDEPPGIVTQDVVRIRLNPKFVIPNYMVFLLNSHYGKALIEQITVQSTRGRFGLGNLKNSRLVLPPIKEQAQIVEFLSRESSRITRTESVNRQSIKLLQEYRTTLISEVVTGKIDVREEVVNSDTTRATH